MLGVSALLVPALWDGVVGRLEGALLLLLLGAYLFYLLKVESNAVEVPTLENEVPLWRSLLLLALGIGLLVVGARLLVVGAAAIARAFGVPEAVIGLTLVAFGTSLPELASSAVAALRKETDIILGNIVGSNIFNILAVLGVTALVKPVEESFARALPDLGVMLLFSVAVLPMMFRRSRLGRVAGGVLLLAYAAYVAYLFV